ncbi:hypothetical protein SNE26_02835 [Mucilaginibacter sp. cycad4]|uniref:hypothetical protein n=1 Tax=Mucilaginibacter sp. cycad4 TaxID=3342096 RepID=UPI002AAC2F1F|nr:hypothetical protein [Mucilaginibacter gossypii]WPV00702.1 hypothetical protein SNE26_02835 [Mucilaginibacter gossypii]
MKPHTFNINIYDLAFLGTIFVGLTFSLMLFITPKGNKTANRILALILLIAVLTAIRVGGTEIHLKSTFPDWNLAAPQFSLALGPLIYFYVWSIIKPDYKFRSRDLLHFCPLLVEIWVNICYTPSFPGLNTVFRSLIFISVCVYLYAAHNLIKDFSRNLKFNRGDRYRLKLRWLNNLLTGFAILWLLWLPFAIIAYLYNDNQSTLSVDFLCLLLAALAIGAAGRVILMPEIRLPADEPYFLKLPSPDEFKYKAGWLKQMMKNGAYYKDRN